MIRSFVVKSVTILFSIYIYILQFLILRNLHIFIVLAYWNNIPRVDVTQLGHIILIPNQSFFALTPECCVLSGEATNTKVQKTPWFDPTGAWTYDLPHSWRMANHYTNDAVSSDFICKRTSIQTHQWITQFGYKKSLKIPKRQSESVYQRRTDNTMA